MLGSCVQTFLTVYRTLSYTQVTWELNIAQPAVSQYIAALERHYGVPLLCGVHDGVDGQGRDVAAPQAQPVIDALWSWGESYKERLGHNVA